MGFKESEECNSREIFLAGMSLTWAEDRYHTESETEPVQPNIQCDYDAWVWNSVRTIMVHEIKLVGCKTLKRNLKKNPHASHISWISTSVLI